MSLFHHNADDDLYAAVAVPTPCDGAGPTHRPSGMESGIQPDSILVLIQRRQSKRGWYVEVYREGPVNPDEQL